MDCTTSIADDVTKAIPAEVPEINNLTTYESVSVQCTRIGGELKEQKETGTQTSTKHAEVPTEESLLRIFRGLRQLVRRAVPHKDFGVPKATDWSTAFFPLFEMVVEADPQLLNPELAAKGMNDKATKRSFNKGEGPNNATTKDSSISSPYLEPNRKVLSAGASMPAPTREPQKQGASNLRPRSSVVPTPDASHDSEVLNANYSRPQNFSDCSKHSDSPNVDRKTRASGFTHINSGVRVNFTSTQAGSEAPTATQIVKSATEAIQPIFNSALEKAAGETSSLAQRLSNALTFIVSVNAMRNRMLSELSVYPAWDTTSSRMFIRCLDLVLQGSYALLKHDEYDPKAHGSNMSESSVPLRELDACLLGQEESLPSFTGKNTIETQVGTTEVSVSAQGPGFTLPEAKKGVYGGPCAPPA